MTAPGAPIRLAAGRLISPRRRVLAYLATVREARACAVRRRADLAWPLERVDSLLRELVREGLIARRDAHWPPRREARGRPGRHVVLYRLAAPATGVGP